MAKKPLPDLTVRAHDLHDSVFKLAAINQAWQSPTNSTQQSHSLFKQMQAQLVEVQGQVRRYSRGIGVHARATD